MQFWFPLSSQWASWNFRVSCLNIVLRPTESWIILGVCFFGHLHIVQENNHSDIISDSCLLFCHLRQLLICMCILSSQWEMHVHVHDRCNLQLWKQSANHSSGDPLFEITKYVKHARSDVYSVLCRALWSMCWIWASIFICHGSLATLYGQWIFVACSASLSRRIQNRKL